MKYFDGIEFLQAGILPDTTLELRFRARSYSVEYIHSGALYLTFNGREYYLEAPCLFQIYPGAELHYNTRGGSLPRTHYYVCFTGPRAERFLSGGLLCPRHEKPFLPVKNPTSFLQLMQPLILLIRSGTRHEKAVMLLENLLYLVLEQESPENSLSTHYTEPLNKLLADIVCEPRKNRNFAREADRLGITLNHFNRIFRRMAQTSPRQFVIHSRLQMAVELLFNTSEEIKEIAVHCGIDNEFYFSRLFKKKYGMSPANYRRVYGGNLP